MTRLAPPAAGDGLSSHDQAPEGWSIDRAMGAYGIPAWGAGYFGINEQGHLTVYPEKDKSREIDLYEVVDHPLSADAITVAVDHPGAGGVVVFSGVVRNETDGRPVKFLEYEAHPPMAVSKMQEIGSAARARWPGIKRVAMQHRIGRLEIGEASVLIAVSAAHRAEAFEACRYAIDTLKRTVPVWKKEHFEDGEVWVGLQSECDHRH